MESIFSVSLFILVSAAPANEAAQDLVQAEALYSRDLFARWELLAESELIQLARKPAVRHWLREKVIAGLNDNNAGAFDREFAFKVLVLSGAGTEEVKLAAQGAKFAGGLPMGNLAETLLEHAPFSLNTVIEKELLAAMVTQHAEKLDQSLAIPLWLAAHRFPLSTVKRLLAASWGKAYPANLRLDDLSPFNCVIELSFKSPNGRALGGPGYVGSLGQWSPSNGLIEPDGKLRDRVSIDLAHSLARDNNNKELKLRTLVPGYREGQESIVTLQPGKLVKQTITLGERRFLFRGRLSPAPKAPLFGMVDSRLPSGQSLNRYGLTSESYVTPVRSDGSFAVPARTTSKRLFFYDSLSNIVHSLPVTTPSADIELGEVKIPEKIALVKIPIELVWPLGATRGSFVLARLDWMPKEPGIESVTFHCWMQFQNDFPEGTRHRFGIARNMYPGDYLVKVQFMPGQGQGIAQDLEVSCRVIEGCEPLVVKPVAATKGAARK